MDHREYAFTASEITQLEHMLSIMPEDHEIERIGLEYRLEKAKETIAGTPIPPRPRLAHVEFRGNPVTHGANGVGIDAHFAGRAIAAFSEAVDAVASEYTQAAPGRCLISDVTHNSFGFLIELPQDTATDALTGETCNPAERAVGTIQDLLEASLREGDTGPASLVDMTHPTARLKVAGFLEILRDSGAQVEIGMDRRRVGLKDQSEVERAAQWLGGSSGNTSTGTNQTFWGKTKPGE